MKMDECLSEKGRKEILSITEVNKVFEKIKDAWNSFSAEERKGFDEKSDQEMKKIFSKVQIDFPDFQRRSWWSAE
jgi:flagellin-specific chaperone FliS